MGEGGVNRNFMNGGPKLLFLSRIAKEEMFGYEIVLAIRSRTDAVVSVGEGVVYPVLHGLERDGAVRSRRKKVNGRSRIYYSLTPAESRRLVDMPAVSPPLPALLQNIPTDAHPAQ